MQTLFTILREGKNNGGRIIWSENQIAYIIEEYNKNHSVPTIAKLFGVSGDAVRRVLRQNGIKVLSLTELAHEKFPRNSDFFETIDSPKKAYWLGFLYADGYVSTENTIRINLGKIDEGHIVKFYDAIQATNHSVKYSEKRMNGKIYEQAYGGLRDSKMVSDLANLGCVNKKSLTLTFPTEEQVPNFLINHFIRGYFDGDGSIHWTQSGNARTPNYRIAFTGTIHMLEGIKKALGIEHLALQKKPNYAIVQICGNRQLERILKQIYDGADETIVLDRKVYIYMQFLLQRFRR